MNGFMIDLMQAAFQQLIQMQQGIIDWVFDPVHFFLISAIVLFLFAIDRPAGEAIRSYREKITR